MSSRRLSTDAQEKLALLRSRYLASLSDKAAAFETALYQCRVHDWKADSVKALNVLSHRLAGSAGSYGLHEIQALAIAVDQATRGAAGITDDSEREALRPKIQILVNTLRRPTDHL